MNYGDKLWEKALIGGSEDCTRERTRCSCAAHDETQETEFVRAVNAHFERSVTGRPACPPRRRAYFGGLLSGGGVDDGDAGGVELMAPFGLLDWSEGGMVVVEPGEVD